MFARQTLDDEDTERGENAEVRECGLERKREKEREAAREREREREERG